MSIPETIERWAVRIRKPLDERIAALKQERDQLQAEVERLSRPVTDEEASDAVAEAMKMEFGGTYQEAMEALITARRKP